MPPRKAKKKPRARAPRAAAGVPVSQIAELLHLTPRRVQQLVVEGVIPKPAKGRYDLVGSVRGYVAALQEQVKRAGVPGARSADPSVVEAERREKVARAQLAEMKAAEMRGLSVSKAAYRAEITAVVQRLRAVILSMPVRHPDLFLQLADRPAAITALQQLTVPLLEELRTSLKEAPPVVVAGEPAA